MATVTLSRRNMRWKAGLQQRIWPFLLGWTRSGCEIQSSSSLPEITWGGLCEHEANMRETETETETGPGTLVGAPKPARGRHCYLSALLLNLQTLCFAQGALCPRPANILSFLDLLAVQGGRVTCFWSITCRPKSMPGNF